MVRRPFDALGRQPFDQRPMPVFADILHQHPALRRRPRLETLPEKPGRLPAMQRLAIQGQAMESRAGELLHEPSIPQGQTVDLWPRFREQLSRTARNPGGGAVAGQTRKRGLDPVGGDRHAGKKLLQPRPGQRLAAPLIVIDDVRGGTSRAGQIGLTPPLALTNECQDDGAVRQNGFRHHGLPGSTSLYRVAASRHMGTTKGRYAAVSRHRFTHP